VQLRALNSLTALFRQFGDRSQRTDIEWGFRPVGNAMLAFGAEGGRRLQAMIDQQQDRQLAELAWQVLYIRQGMENFCPLTEPEQEAARNCSCEPAAGDLDGGRSGTEVFTAR
jgi:hypothetical protein